MSYDLGSKFRRSRLAACLQAYIPGDYGSRPQSRRGIHHHRADGRGGHPLPAGCPVHPAFQPRQQGRARVAAGADIVAQVLQRARFQAMGDRSNVHVLLYRTHVDVYRAEPAGANPPFTRLSSTPGPAADGRPDRRHLGCRGGERNATHWPAGRRKRDHDRESLQAATSRPSTRSSSLLSAAPGTPRAGGSTSATSFCRRSTRMRRSS